MRSVQRTSGLTYADLEAFPEDNIRREIIDGELVVSPSPRIRHQRIVLRLGIQIHAHVEQHGLGEVFFVMVDVVLAQDQVFVPDVLFIANDRLAQLTEKNLQGPPTLAVEVLSDARRDRIVKRDRYERFGVPEYWIVDPDADRVEVYRLTDGGYGKPEILEPGDALATPHLPDLSIDLTELFRLD